MHDSFREIKLCIDKYCSVCSCVESD